MIKTETIINQLRLNIPFNTELFSQSHGINSLAISGTTATATTDTAHGLTTGDTVSISGAITPIEIESATFTLNNGIGATSGTVTIVTATDHDFTEGFYQQAVITGIDQADYNGTFDIADVPNRRKFTYKIDSAPVTPATGSTMRVLYEFSYLAGGFNGTYSATYISNNSFSYEVLRLPTLSASGVITATTGVRISGATSIEKATNAYTRQAKGDLWGFVILGDNSVSKNRHVASDAIETLTDSNEYRLRVICPFSLIVISPSKNSIAGLEDRDLMEEIKPAIFKSLLRSKLETVVSNSSIYNAVYTGDSFVAYADAYYIHSFEFEVVADITVEDTMPYHSVAFRDFDLIFKDPLASDGDDIIMQTTDISLDDEPL